MVLVVCVCVGVCVGVWVGAWSLVICRTWSVIVRSDTKQASFLVVFLGTTRNEVVSFRISEKRDKTKVVSTISACRVAHDPVFLLSYVNKFKC